jgi:predicted ArsR family transcriptional regulator
LGVARLEPPPDPADSLNRLVALCDPVRRELYLFVVGRGEFVSRAEAADAVGVRRGLAAHHLDRLAEDGLLDVVYQRMSGRTGPGAGRPAKLYRRATGRVEVSLPPRNAMLVAALLAAATARVGAAAAPVIDEFIGLAHDAGRTVGVGARPKRRAADHRRRTVVQILREFGYSPQQHDRMLTLDNCPYAPLPDTHRELVCGMNRAFVAGLLDGVGLRGEGCELAPAPDRCCVVVRSWAPVSIAQDGG